MEEKGVLPPEALLNIRPFLHNMGKDPFEVSGPQLLCLVHFYVWFTFMGTFLLFAL